MTVLKCLQVYTSISVNLLKRLHSARNCISLKLLKHLEVYKTLQRSIDPSRVANLRGILKISHLLLYGDD